MNVPAPVRNANPPRARNWDALAAVLAAGIGFLALMVSGYTAHIQRQQVRAQVWPHLVAGNDDGNQLMFVCSQGVGPAIAKSAQVFIDGKPQPHWAHVLAALGLPTKEYARSMLNPGVISANEQVREELYDFLGYFERKLDALFAGGRKGRLG